MGRLLKAEGTSQVINPVYQESQTTAILTSRNSFGPTDKKGLGAQVGSMMSSAEKWLMEEKSFGITGVGILLSVLVFFGLVFTFIKLTRNRDSFAVGAKTYYIIGAAQIEDNGRKVYVPVYQEMK